MTFEGRKKGRITHASRMRALTKGCDPAATARPTARDLRFKPSPHGMRCCRLPTELPTAQAEEALPTLIHEKQHVGSKGRDSPAPQKLDILHSPITSQPFTAYKASIISHYQAWTAAQPDPCRKASPWRGCRACKTATEVAELLQQQPLPMCLPALGPLATQPPGVEALALTPRCNGAAVVNVHSVVEARVPEHAQYMLWQNRLSVRGAPQDTKVSTPIKEIKAPWGKAAAVAYQTPQGYHRGKAVNCFDHSSQKRHENTKKCFVYTILGKMATQSEVCCFGMFAQKDDNDPNLLGLIA
eukprot:1161954-Pelagomonas_calceolata.AAC.2